MGTHRWTALGSAPMTSAEAARWATAEPLDLVDSPLDVHFPVVLCTICLESPDRTPNDCAGPPPGEEDGHLWQASLTAAVSDAEVRAWNATDEGLSVAYAQAAAVTCLLCGQSATGASGACPERVTSPADETALTVADVLGTDPAVESRVPRYELASDTDGDLHVVAHPDEPDAEDWRVFGRLPDGTTREVEQTPFWSTGFGPLQGRPSWYAGNAFTVEIHVAGRAAPYVVTGGRFSPDELPEGITRPGWGSWEVDPD